MSRYYNRKGQPVAATEDEARAVIARLTQAETVTGEGGAA